MNANHILRGNEYAYVDYPSRGVAYYPMAERCRVMYVYKVEDTWSKRKQTLVEVEMLDNETGESINNNGNLVRTIRARQIVARWDEHLVEKARHDQEARERRERALKQQEEFERRREEAQRIQEEQDAGIYEAFASIGIPRERIALRSYELSIRISRPELDKLIEEHRKEVLNEHHGEGVRSESD